MTVTQALLAANVVVYLLQGSYGETLLVELALWPLGSYPLPGAGEVGFRPWQLVTSAFLHGNLQHLALNMLGLWMFGRDIERLLGSRRFGEMYAAAVLTAGVTQLAVVSASGDVYPTVGASGGVFGILLAFGYLFPDRRVVLLFPPIPMPARVFVALYGALELAHGILGTAQGVAHFAHLGGMLGAGLMLALWRRSGVLRRAPGAGRPRSPWPEP